MQGLPGDPDHAFAAGEGDLVAGVSPKTVSNVLTGAAGVRQQTRAKVESAMVELDFVPNLSARGLRNGRSGVIGFALPDVGTAFSASITHAMLEVAHERGVMIQIEETAAEPEREYDLVSRARTHQVDGLILNPVRLEDSVVERLDHLPPPVVLIGEVEQHRTDRVFVNSRAAGRLSAEHMIDQGARRVAVLGGGLAGSEDRKATMGQRLQGYIDGVTRRGLPAPDELQVEVIEWTIEGGAAGMRELLRREVAFDAVIAFTDSIAMGALYALHEAGVRVPEDVLVSGFDDVQHAAYTWPPLTTVRFDHHHYVREAMDLLAERIADRSIGPRAVEIPHALTARRSSDAWPAGYVPPSGR
ncbi:LacI family DNA-binding transcriptional regulator [Nesterenkonia lacusekhoensis]|uniref:DNA-binding LacI/PurR family transcriptional regulator n=1 Tax=Nesterenkonia lacusekhoensis TaxID=150832 RepID=A0ABS4T459_9MICC|nr:LacI family DNA-binding transcriptional regulator [Nesterenkonia lacusekhoensis]MBP2319242.1 DNA-binding LacI/PurR family transcriptional regulator [Nesterenkonia lacusekhoensis]